MGARGTITAPHIPAAIFSNQVQPWCRNMYKYKGELKLKKKTHHHLEHKVQFEGWKKWKDNIERLQGIVAKLAYLLIEMLLLLLPHLLPIVRYKIISQSAATYFRWWWTPRFLVLLSSWIVSRRAGKREKRRKSGYISIHSPVFLLPGNQISASAFPLSTGWKIEAFGTDLFVSFDLTIQQ